ncbi:S9 family peptidase [Plebeiibacterium marinum]|uniref:S9 family peptidase n=1 Tax=Plebeiibacterium marinum TaxID=2992111 RepID=A0AAE3MD12_9BACT|nr:S9 family peptidase [Plebeiobacterium marinum]MCW3805414.1 S9 family peptidase [Plebeiobacterium marinum]
MKKIFVFLALLIPLNTFAQTKTVSLEDLNKFGTFAARGINKSKSMADGIHYTTLEKGTQINKYAYSSGKKVATLFDIANIKDCPIQHIQDYEINSTNTKILVYTNQEMVYRRTFKANFFVYDIKRKEIKPLSEGDKQQAAEFSPDGEMVSFVKNNDVYIYKIKFDTETRVTKDGEFNKIINGVPDWVYEEEFEYNKATAWSPNSTELAYVRFDETNVKKFSFPVYKGSNPTHNEYALYPGEYNFKYPKAGEENAKVSVKVFHIKNRTTKTMKIEEGDYYLPRIKWTQEPGKLGILKLNRLQNQFDLLIANTATAIAQSVFTHRNDYYLDVEILNDLTFSNDGKYFIYVSEMDGYNHIHLYTMAGMKVRQLTKGEWDVTDFYGYDENKKLLYYQAAKVSSTQREVYAVSIDGKKDYKLTSKTGMHSADFSTGFKYFINTFSNTSTPPQYTLHTQSGKYIRTLQDNASLKETVSQFRISPKEFFTFTTSQGVELNGWMVKPLDFDTNNKYPVLMTQYSGPNSQEVLDEWSVGWEQYLASQGYLVACIDPRGTGARGEEFRKCTYMKLGQIESNDQIEGARYLGSLNYTDASRIGIWGWSYGGFMSCSCLSKANGIFKVGIAVAPVTNWRYYDSVYTERFMRKPQENPKGYDENSPINMADNLTGRLFIIHGMADDNVHFQNTVEYIEQLIQANKQFDMFAYPNRNHGIYGGNTRMHLYQMMSDYLKKNL